MHPTRRHASGHKPRRGHYTSRCKHWSGLSQGRCRRKLTCLPPSEPCQHIARLGEATIPADANTGQAPHCAHKEACSPFILLWGRSCTTHGFLIKNLLKTIDFHWFFFAFLCSGNIPAPGASGDGFGGPGAFFFAYSRTAIWALFAKQEGHQIASTITTCTRTDEEPCIPGPLCSCTDTDLFGTLLPAGRSNFGGSPRAQSYMIRPDLVDTATWESGR